MRNFVSEPLHLFFARWGPTPPSPQFPESQTFLQATQTIRTQLSGPYHPELGSAARGIQASPGLSHNGVPSSQRKSSYSLGHLANCRPQEGRPGLGEGSKWRLGRPLQEEGLGGRKDGRQRGGQKLRPSHRGTLAGGWADGGPDRAFLPHRPQPAG